MKTVILIVEDSPTQAETLLSLLEEHEYEVAVARNGMQALETLDKGSFDLVISDVMMPGMDGYQLCRTIKSRPEWRGIPVLLLTSLNDPLDIIRGLESGADNFLTKPYDPGQLLDRISFVLDNRSDRRSKLQMGIGINFLGQNFTITADKQQILDLLISTFEDAVLHNKQLQQREEELERARTQLARYAGTLEERVERILESVPDIVYSISADRRELYYMSPACTRITGFTPQQFAADPSRTWESRIDADHCRDVILTYKRVAKIGQPETIEYPLHDAGGEVHWIEETIVGVRGEDGSVVRMDCVARDITDRKRLEEQVRLAQKMEALGTLAGGIAHDFNNLLTAIRGNAELALAELPADMQAREDVEQIIELSGRAAGITRQLLALGRQQVIEPRLINVHELVGRSTSMLRRFIGEDIDLRVVSSDTDLTIWADPNQVEQVLMNLSINARHAMPSGGELAIELGRETVDEEGIESHPAGAPGDYVSVAVRDTGTGVSPDVVARIFEPFFTTREVGEGSGLGLAVVYSIVKQHGGFISVDSEPGRGTTFQVRFPLRTEAPREPDPSDAVPAVGGTETILYAEDEESVRRVTARQLRNLGYAVIEAENGAAALDVLKERGHEIDLVVTDMIMPRMNGLDLFQNSRAMCPALKFLFVTGYSPGKAPMTPVSGVPAPVLPKPFAIHDLAARIREALQQESA